MSCPTCGLPTIQRRSGLLVHQDRTRDADHLPVVRLPGDARSDEELQAREREILGILAAAGFEELPLEPVMPAAYRAAGYATMSPLEQRYADGDR